MSTTIDPRAIIAKNVTLGENVTVGPFAIIEENVSIGSDTKIGASAYIGSDTTIGQGCQIYNHASVGTLAQDLKYAGEACSLTIGDRTMIREFCTINKGTEANRGRTIIGSDCALLAYCHVGHDCIIGNHFIASNGLALAGHVRVGDHVICGGNVSVHQFTQIGSHAFIGANKYVTMDVVPFALVAGDTLSAFIYGINSVGLKRRGFTAEERRTIKSAITILLRKGHTRDAAVALLQERWPHEAHVETLLSFIEKSTRGLLQFKK
ncbi:acyl-ACP--UDP-N-acetylglucosamine O-acyltransferase [Chitinivibrio alkaliphilus]|uniref:Acyl-(Acyl-carrier-protein)--UDP-N-acetylglucosamine O-acyltransferase n=1 Tax=Chitinivibrio alkaliphilus ACht1 TaxID=1313304 RepID=U7D734_9BACT|nr:acyl-ACP--UDP-N-acetylglucosamine O-acyltransferase [Chitinivibrio alkaliphilus]ERP31758.1 acyl-(acyl-carrier-protein)--UDP-N-acetylglucosamine O-acyltransferase [Chitinivibrio alkaliphilus ACht1]